MWESMSLPFFMEPLHESEGVLFFRSSVSLWSIRCLFLDPSPDTSGRTGEANPILTDRVFCFVYIFKKNKLKIVEQRS